jgi:hypothetical protein
MSTTPLAGPVTRLARNGKHDWARSGWIVLACLAAFLLVAKHAKLPTTPATPNGIELEIPGTSDGALAVMRALVDTDPHNLDRARTAIVWDFLLILSYSLGLATLLEWLATRDPDNADPLIGYAAWGALVAGAADIIENLSMLTLISKYEHLPDSNLGFPALISTLASLTKWTLLFAVVGYAVWELAKRLVQALRRKLMRIPSKEAGDRRLSSAPE